MRATGIIDHPFREAYAAKLGALPGAANAWVDGLRQSARAVLNASGLPGPKNEAWKFTNLNDLAKIGFQPASRADDVDVRDLPIGVPNIPGARRIVLVNGVFQANLSDPIPEAAGLRISPLQHMLAREPQVLKPTLGGLASAGLLAGATLNTAFMYDGLYIAVGKSYAGPALHIISIGASGADPLAFHPRTLLTLDRGAQLTVIETHVGLPGQPYLSNPVTEIVLADGARLKRYVGVQDDSDAFHIGVTAATLAANAGFESFHLGLGGLKVRHDISVAMEGEGAECRLNGVYGLAGKQHHDIATLIEHRVPHGSSSQVVKGVVDGHSHGVFQGRIHVAPHAQKTDARQLHKAMFLTKGPTVDCKPELEIFADDVQCAHGAATGEIDPAHLFYLMARGIDRTTARAMLTAAFIEEAVDTISDADIRATFSDAIQSWLKRRAA